MAVAGSDQTSFTLGGRRIQRSGGQLRLENGTLAGADLDLTTALSVMVNSVGVEREAALLAATRTPADLIGLTAHRMTPGETGVDELIRIRNDLSGLRPIVGADA